MTVGTDWDDDHDELIIEAGHRGRIEVPADELEAFLDWVDSGMAQTLRIRKAEFSPELLAAIRRFHRRTTTLRQPCTCRACDGSLAADALVEVEYDFMRTSLDRREWTRMWEPGLQAATPGGPEEQLQFREQMVFDPTTNDLATIASARTTWLPYARLRH